MLIYRNWFQVINSLEPVIYALVIHQVQTGNSGVNRLQVHKSCPHNQKPVAVETRGDAPPSNHQVQTGNWGVNVHKLSRQSTTRQLVTAETRGDARKTAVLTITKFKLAAQVWMDSRCTAQVVSTNDDTTTGSRRASWGLVYNIISTVETGGDARKTVGDS